jgi:DNA-binding transcriptional MerR regulator
VTAYSRREVARIFHISASRLRYWERTRLVRASAEADSGAAFDFRDLRSIQHVLGLLERGVPLRRIRRSLSDVARRLPELAEPLPALQVWAEGSPRMVVEHAGGLFEPGGQMVLDFRASGPGEERVAALPAVGSPLDASEWFERGCTLDADAATWGEAIDAYHRALQLDP